ncbi:MAG TPA: hypothetical protein VFY36_07450 [Solirubrobacteraceae bacterium]|nr:hypothetical protein [Solirubrobacteraceae bacterium]
METRYAAYGLNLSCSFQLVGMRATAQIDNDLPSLALALREPSEIDHEWSGSTGPPQWRGRLGDGLDLTIETGATGEVLFAYGDRARFRLHRDMSQLDCAPAHEGLDWQRALIGKVIPAISVMLGYEALHGAVVDSPDGVVAIMAPSGSGKSTLAIELLGRGWPLFADDVLILEDSHGTVRAHAGTPHMNIAEPPPGTLDPQTLGDTLGILAGERWLAAGKTTMRPRPVRMLCVLQRGAELTTQTRTLTSNPLSLAPYMLGLSTDPERQRSRFSLYADLMDSTALVQITADLAQRPTQIADLLEDALESSPELSTSGVR